MSLVTRPKRPGAIELYAASQVLLLAGAAAGAVLTSKTSDWQPLWAVALLAATAVGADMFPVRLGHLLLSGSFISLALAMVVLGPAPASAIGALTMLAAGARSRTYGQLTWLTEVATYMAFPLVGGLLVRGLLGHQLHVGVAPHLHGADVALAVAGVYVATILLNFALIATHYRVREGRGFVLQARTVLAPVVSSEAAMALLTALVATAYVALRDRGPVLIGVVAVLAVFTGLVRALARSEERADQLAVRSTQLAQLQVGVLATLLETLALRDPATARHGASVGRLARALAKEASLSEREQDLVATAGLLHDIGKFVLPDRILHAEELTEAERGLVRRHSQDGAGLVGRLDGYGPVAEILLYHHERIDGTGYPAGLIGREIPLLARIVAVCEVYDTLTARDSYRTPVTPVEAFAELRNVAGRQLDADLVDRLIVMIQRDPAAFAVESLTSSDAEAEFTRLARAMAEPQS
jgi:HD-GYP domain-containing protein (c-di-GMP phosphodiesterase class II)